MQHQTIITTLKTSPNRELAVLRNHIALIQCTKKNHMRVQTCTRTSREHRAMSCTGKCAVILSPPHHHQVTDCEAIHTAWQPNLHPCPLTQFNLRTAYAPTCSVNPSLGSRQTGPFSRPLQWLPHEQHAHTRGL